VELSVHWVVFVFFLVATTALGVYGLHMYVLLFLFRRRSKKKRAHQRAVIQRYWREVPEDSWPRVTTQLPVFNEADVAVRVIESVAAMDYPTDKHEIQVLDDSDDHTCGLVDRTVERLAKQGVNIRVVRRPTREGYKAGALVHGLNTACGEYVAIFDADFTPTKEFLRRAIPLLENAPQLACLQGRWDHLNRKESLLTEAQALGIDGHFAIEQGARAWNDLMMNFNGTAGVWRRAAIDDAKVGGWNGDTLTEDLDLSYRAQLAGWRLDYCLDLPAPAELPGTIGALKSQQRRWATGSIQVAKKLLPRIWRSKVSLGEKLEATLHLTHYTVSVYMLILAIVARPMLLVYADGRVFGQWFWPAWIIILLAAVAPSLTYAYARYSLGGRWSGLKTIPCMIILGCGLCVNNALAVFRGLYLVGGEFVRTPKSGSQQRVRRASSYRAMQNHLWIIELLLGVYSAICFVVYFQSEHQAFSFFLLFYAIGFTVVGWYSLRETIRKASSTTPRTKDSSVLPAHVPPVGSSSGGR
jgi:cellulose synthase/poly-beta-1,6-N-acetylglucosamine synthase-like glycosyltransferase